MSDDFTCQRRSAFRWERVEHALILWGEMLTKNEKSGEIAHLSVINL